MKNIMNVIENRDARNISKILSKILRGVGKISFVIESRFYKSKVLLCGVLFASGNLYAAVDITTYIYNFQNQQNNTNQGNPDGVYYSVDMNTWSTFGASVAMEFLNGTLILGNNKKEVNNVNGNTNFGGNGINGGLIGVMKAEFYAKDIYLTGNMITGNSAGTGGGTTININGTSQPTAGGALRTGTITADGLNIFVRRAGTQGSATRLQAKYITINNSNLRVGRVDGADSGIHIGNLNNHNEAEMVIINNTHVTGDGGVFRVYAKDSKLNFSGLNGDGGTFDLRYANYSSLEFTGSIDVSNFKFYIKDTNIYGGIQGGYFTNVTLEDGTTTQDFKANTVTINQTPTDGYGIHNLKANNVDITTLELLTGIGGADRYLNINSTGIVNIGNLKNDRSPNAYAGFNAGLVTNADTYIKNVEFNDYWAPINFKNDLLEIKVNNGKNLTIDSISYSADGTAVYNKHKVYLEAKDGDVIVKDVSGKKNGSICVEGGGICNYNTLEIVSKNFYGGVIEATGLKGVDANSKLDLRGVTGTKFVDYLTLMSGTLFAKDFHVNTMYIKNSNFYSRVDTNIGKSFINNVIATTSELGSTSGGEVDFRGGGDVLNINSLTVGSGAYFYTEGSRHGIDGKSYKIDNVNINKFIIGHGKTSFQNLIINDLEATNTQTFATGNSSTITANAMNVNGTMHLKNASKHGAALSIQLHGIQQTPTQITDYLNIDIDSTTLQGLSVGDIQNLITRAEANITTTNHKNASGTYITTNDGKKYVLLPGIMTHKDIPQISQNMQADNEGNILIEQKDLTQGTLNNYGSIYLDNGLNDKYVRLASAPLLDLNGNLENYGVVTIGATGRVQMTGKFTNHSKLVFKLQDNYANEDALKANNSVVSNGVLNITGSAVFDISPGSSGAFQADIANSQTLRNIKLATAGTTIENDANTYKLLNTTQGIQYKYTYGDYTTTMESSTSLKTESTKNCGNATCATTDLNNGNGAQQTTKWTENGKDNPWNTNKSQIDSNTGGTTEKPLGENMNNDSILGRDDGDIKIEKPSQADKYANCKANGYCGFGSDKNASEAEKAYDYAKEKLKANFNVTYMGSDISGKYLQVEKMVTDNVAGFRILKKDINASPEANEIPLCNTESSSFDCVLYMEAGGNNSWINALKKESKNSYNILKDLFYNENSELLMLIQLDQSLAISRNIEYFLEIGRTLDTTFQHVSSLENKSSTLQTLNLAMDSAKANRLAKIAYYQSPEYEALAFQEYRANTLKAEQLAAQVKALRNNYTAFNNIESKGVKVAVLDSTDSTESANDSIESNYAVANHHTNVETIYDAADNTDTPNNEAWFNTIADLIVRFQTRGENPNNLWANALGNVSFSTTGSNQLYGFNAGYDYYSRTLHTALGLYVGYGYGIFTGNNNGYISNKSQNIFAGLYTRTFIGNNEFDITISASRGFINESIQAQKRGFDLLDLFNQRYSYNVTNLEGNFTYGYAFILKKGYTIKPFLGASYYISTSTGYNREASGVFEIDTNDNARHAVGVNVGIEGRKYFKNQSYIFLNAQFRQDVYILKNNLDSKRLATSNVSNTESNLAFSFDYRGDSFRSNMFVSAGGELALGRFYINTSLTSYTSVISKNFGFGANAGFRFVF